VRRGSASTTGFDGPPLVTGAQIGDSARASISRSASSLYQRNTTGRGQRVLAAMQDGVLNLAVKLRDQQRLDSTCVMKEYPQPRHRLRRSGAARQHAAAAASRAGFCGLATDPNAYIYFITQARVELDLQGDR
jgi:formyl-CoA transferase